MAIKPRLIHPVPCTIINLKAKGTINYHDVFKEPMYCIDGSIDSSISIMAWLCFDL